MEELPYTQGGVSGFAETRLKGFNAWTMDKVSRRPIAPRGRSELPREDRRPRWRTEDTGSMRIRKVHATGSQAVNVGRDRSRCRLKTTNPVVHVIDRQEKNVRFLLGITENNREYQRSKNKMFAEVR